MLSVRILKPTYYIANNQYNLKMAISKGIHLDPLFP